MRVTGDFYHNVLFEPNYSELPALLRVFAGRLVITKLGWEFKENVGVPSLTVKDALYYDLAALKTRSYDTKQALLSDFKRAIDNQTGIITDASQGLILGGGYRITQDNLGYNANHVPQLFSLIPNAADNTKILTGFVGDYDFKSRLFRGQMQIQKYGEVWNG